MNRIAKKLTLLFGAALVVGLLSAVPASASVNGNCAVEGTAHTNPPVKLQGGSGNYTFDDLLFACVGTVDGVTDVTSSNITTSGAYQNITCGTGFAQSSVAQGVITQSATGTSLGKTFEAQYNIAFTDGVGQLTFRAPASGSGVIDIIPTGPQAPNPSDPPDQFPCTNSFAVAGEVTLVIP